MKIKRREEAEFIIGGYMPGPNGVASVFVGEHRPDGLHCVGEVQWGFAPGVRAAIDRQCRRLVRVKSPFRNLLRKQGVTWVAPQLVVIIAFQEYLSGALRAPTFRGLREDLLLSE